MLVGTCTRKSLTAALGQERKSVRRPRYVNADGRARADLLGDASPDRQATTLTQASSMPCERGSRSPCIVRERSYGSRGPERHRVLMTCLKVFVRTTRQLRRRRDVLRHPGGARRTGHEGISCPGLMKLPSSLLHVPNQSVLAWCDRIGLPAGPPAQPSDVAISLRDETRKKKPCDFDTLFCDSKAPGIVFCC